MNEPPSPQPQDFIYPLSTLSGYTFENKNPISPENFWKGALQGATTTWGLSTGFRLMEPGDRVWAYFGRSVRMICGIGIVGSKGAFPSPERGRYAIDITWDRHLTARLRQEPISYDEFHQHVQGAAVRASDVTLKVLSKWLRNQGRDATEHARTVKFVMQDVERRLGQGKFRSDVLQAYGSTCAISGSSETRVLEAAHIWPIASGGQHAADNALLLRADLHNLFDLGMITIAPKWRIEVSSQVQDAEYRRFHGKSLNVPRGVKQVALKQQLARHRNFHLG